MQEYFVIFYQVHGPGLRYKPFGENGWLYERKLKIGVVLMAVERGKLQNLIFDNQVLFNHRAMAAVLGVILKLPRAKQILASNQFRSRYLLAIIRKYTRNSQFMITP